MPSIVLTYSNAARCWVMLTLGTFGNVSNLPNTPYPVIGRAVFDPDLNTLRPLTMALSARTSLLVPLIRNEPPGDCHISTDTTPHELWRLKCTMYSKNRQGQDLHFH